jgi:hypothetical protein
MTERARPKRPSVVAMTAKITAIAVAIAIALTGGLAIQMAAGHDPTLASKAKRQASSHANAVPQPVVTRTS